MSVARSRGVRIGMVCLLILAAAWGTQARAGLRWDQLHLSAVAQLGALAVVCLAAASLVARLLSGGFRHRRSKDGDQHEHVIQIPMSPGERLQLVAAAVLVTAATVVVVWLLATRFGGSSPPGLTSPTVRATPSAQPSTTAAHASATLGGQGVWILLGVIGFLLVVAATTALLRRRSRVAGKPIHSAAPQVAPNRTSIRDQADDDPRAAVITAYRAFEQEAARRGISVEPPETAREISASAVGAQLATLADVQELTRLFHRARYSRAPVPAQDQADALRLLETLRQQMRSTR